MSTQLDLTTIEVEKIWSMAKTVCDILKEFVIEISKEKGFVGGWLALYM